MKFISAIGAMVCALASGTATASPAVIWSPPSGNGYTYFYGPSIYPYPVPVGYGTLGPIAPDGVNPSSYGWGFSFNGADYNATISGAYTYATTPTVTTISGWVKLSSTLNNNTNILTTIDSIGSLTIPIELLQNATVSSSFWSPGDPALATGTYQGFGFANAGPAGPAAALPSFNVNGNYTPGYYFLGGTLTSHFEAGLGNWATQDVMMNFSVVIEAIPASGTAALLGLGGLVAARRRRR